MSFNPLDDLFKSQEEKNNDSYAQGVEQGQSAGFFDEIGETLSRMIPFPTTDEEECRQKGFDFGTSHKPSSSTSSNSTASNSYEGGGTSSSDGCLILIICAVGLVVTVTGLNAFSPQEPKRNQEAIYREPVRIEPPKWLPPRKLDPTPAITERPSQTDAKKSQKTIEELSYREKLEIKRVIGNKFTNYYANDVIKGKLHPAQQLSYKHGNIHIFGQQLTDIASEYSHYYDDAWDDLGATISENRDPSVLDAQLKLWIERTNLKESALDRKLDDLKIRIVGNKIPSTGTMTSREELGTIEEDNIIDKKINTISKHLNKESEKQGASIKHEDSIKKKPRSVKVYDEQGRPTTVSVDQESVIIHTNPKPAIQNPFKVHTKKSEKLPKDPVKRRYQR